MGNTYADLLKDPRWQKKRLEIMERAEWECEECGDKQATLHVHHMYYEWGLKPWDHPSESLRCLCEDCHKISQALGKALKRQLGKLSSISDLERLLAYAYGLEMICGGGETQVEVPSYEFAAGLANCWEIHPDQVLMSVEDGKVSSFMLDAISAEDFCRKRSERQARESWAGSF